MRLFRGERDITEEVPASALGWKRISRDPVLATGDAAWNASHAGAQVEITANEIAKLCRFECSYSETEGVFGSVNVDESLMASHNPGVSDASDILHLDDGMLVVSGSPRGGNADYYLEDGKLMVNPGFTGTITAVADFSPEAQQKVVSFFYDHNGLRTRKVVWDHGVTETYDYTLHGKLITHMTKRREDENGNVNSQDLHFFYDSQSKPAFVEFEGERYRYAYNLQKDVIAILDANGAIVVEYIYNSWGKLQQIIESQENVIGMQNPFRYRGYFWDNDESSYYLRSRNYDPVWGRFISPDVIAEKRDDYLVAENNIYAYCFNNANSFSDDDGYLGFLATVLTGAAIGGFGSVLAELAVSLVTGERSSMKELATSFISGAVDGALSAAGVGRVLSTAISTMVDGAAYYFECVEDGKAYEKQEVAIRFGYSVAMGLANPVISTQYGSNHLSEKTEEWVSIGYDAVCSGVGKYYDGLREKYNPPRKNQKDNYTKKRVYDPLLGCYRDIIIYA